MEDRRAQGKGSVWNSRPFSSEYTKTYVCALKKSRYTKGGSFLMYIQYSAKRYDFAERGSATKARNDCQFLVERWHPAVIQALIVL